MHIVGVDIGQHDLPALRFEPASQLVGGLLLGPAFIAFPSDQDAAGLDHVEITTLECAGGDVIVDRDAETLVGLDAAIVLAAPPPLTHIGDDRTEGRHDRAVTGVDLIGQLRIRHVGVNLDTGALIGGHHLGMLGRCHLRVEPHAPAQRLLGQRRGLQPPVVLDRAKQDRTQRAVV